MAEQRKIKQATVNAVIKRAKAGAGRTEIMQAMDLDSVSVGVIFAAHKLGKKGSKPEVVERDKARLAKWLEAGRSR
jgi:hypothetical protein